MKKRFILYVLVLLVLFHFMLVATYILAPGVYSRWYVDPLFHQNWNLFVPAPDANFSLLYHAEGDPAAHDLIGELAVIHQNNRLQGSEATLIAFTNAIHYCFAENGTDKKISGVSGKSTLILLKMLKNQLKLQNQIPDPDYPLWLIKKDLQGVNHVLKLQFPSVD